MCSQHLRKHTPPVACFTCLILSWTRQHVKKKKLISILENMAEKLQTDALRHFPRGQHAQQTGCLSFRGGLVVGLC